MEAALQVTVRRAVVADAAAMAKVARRAALMGYEGILPPSAPLPTTEDLVEAWQLALADDRVGAAVFVACESWGDRPVMGTVAVAPDDNDPSRGALHALYVDPANWGWGIGRLLHDTALEHLQQCGIKVASVSVYEPNVRARAMFERWGWSSSTTRPGALPGVNEVFYVRQLDHPDRV